MSQHLQAIMDQLEPNQVALREEVSHVRSQMRQLMEIIQVVARGQEIMAKMQEEMDQCAHTSNPILVAHPLVVENPVPSPPNNTLAHIPVGAPGSVPRAILNPSVIEIDDQQDAFFSPMAASMYEAFAPPANEVEKKVKAIEEKLRTMESTNALGLDAAEICLVPSVIIPAKFKIPDFEKYKGASDPTMHIQDYSRKMATYSYDELLLMHFFQDSLSGASLDWYIQLEGTHIRTWREMVEAFLKHY